MLKHDSGLNLDGAYKEYRVTRGNGRSIPKLLKDRIIHVGCPPELSVRRLSGGDAEIAVRRISRDTLSVGQWRCQ